MGCRLHSATKYEVEWGVNSVFNWGQNHITPIIEHLSDGDFWCDSMDCIEGASMLEASRENLIKNVEYIINPNPEWEGQEVLDDMIAEMENSGDVNFSREYLYTELKRLIDEADAQNAYIHFSWF